MATAALASLCVACGGSGASAPVTSSSTAHLQTTTAPTDQRGHAAASRDWLGLDYNSGTGAREYGGGTGPGGLREFSRYGIVYDRLGALEVDAGWTVANTTRLAHGMRVSLGAGMIPDVLVDPTVAPRGCTTDPEPVKLCLPVTPVQIQDYVRGFVSTATSILSAYPHSGVMFEPLNEPWDWAGPPETPSGQTAAQQYANLLASLLPAAKRARIPLSTIYVPLTGALDDGTEWIKDLYAARPCLEPGRDTCGPIEGWNAHPYGLPMSDTSGISMLPQLRTEMQSGENNIIVSEIGFCSSDVDSGRYCDLNVSQVDGTNTQTSQWLSETLTAAAQMHRAGWLKALIIWARSFGGWSLQAADGQLTAQGKVLTQFATRQQAGS